MGLLRAFFDTKKNPLSQAEGQMLAGIAITIAIALSPTSDNKARHAEYMQTVAHGSPQMKRLGVPVPLAADFEYVRTHAPQGGFRSDDHLIRATYQHFEETHGHAFDPEQDKAPAIMIGA